MQIELQNQKLTFKTTLSHAWAVFKSQFSSIALVSLIIYTPIHIGLSYFTIGEDGLNANTYVNIIKILEFFFGVIAVMAIARITKNTLQGEKTDPQDALQESLSRWPAVIKTNILAGLFLVGLFLLFIVPGIIFYVYWVFTTHIVVLNNLSGNAALNYSKQLVKGRWHQVALYGIGLALITFAIALIASSFYFLAPNSQMAVVVIDILTEVPFAFVSVAYAVLFLHLEATYKEEADIDSKASNS